MDFEKLGGGEQNIFLIENFWNIFIKLLKQFWIKLKKKSKLFEEKKTKKKMIKTEGSTNLTLMPVLKHLQTVVYRLCINFCRTILNVLTLLIETNMYFFVFFLHSNPFTKILTNFWSKLKNINFQFFP